LLVTFELGLSGSIECHYMPKNPAASGLANNKKSSTETAELNGTQGCLRVSLLLPHF
jgi:hypothetical protein